MRSTGHPNYNHAAYLEISDAFARDARVVLERAPELWWESAGHAWELHFLPIHDYTFFHEKRRAAGPWMRRVERVYEAASGSLAFARWSWEEPMPPFPERPGWAWAVAMALALAVAAVVASRRRRGRATSATLLYCAMTIVWVSLVGNSLEVGENQRFRFLSEPLTWVLVALALDRLLDGARAGCGAECERCSRLRFAQVAGRRPATGALPVSTRHRARTRTRRRRRSRNRRRRRSRNRQAGREEGEGRVRARTGSRRGRCSA
ncbi:MAG: hypothetical protein M5U28_01895 [Sandaracinaceae bacterium]|nr:hypothetical protein [Sandaracinaceae bacterium]